MWQFLFPAKSLTGEGEKWLTQKEWRELEGEASVMFRPQLRMQGCRNLDLVLAGDRYGRSILLRRMIQLFKYRRIEAYKEPLAQILKRPLGLLSLNPGTVLCPVPLHWTRRFLRGFNQAEILADLIAKEAEMDVVHLLRRTRMTGWQSHRKKWEDRAAAMHNAFALRTAKMTLPVSVLLVDDICTSGATLDACAYALKQVGVQWVGGLVVARR